MLAIVPVAAILVWFVVIPFVPGLTLLQFVMTTFVVANLSVILGAAAISWRNRPQD